MEAASPERAGGRPLCGGILYATANVCHSYLSKLGPSLLSVNIFTKATAQPEAVNGNALTTVSHPYRRTSRPNVTKHNSKPKRRRKNPLAKPCRKNIQPERCRTPLKFGHATPEKIFRRNFEEKQPSDKTLQKELRTKRFRSPLICGHTNSAVNSWENLQRARPTSAPLGNRTPSTCEHTNSEKYF